MKTILVPTDFSKNARNAIRFALELGRDLNARLLLFHVYQVSVPVSEVPLVLLPDYEIDRINQKKMKDLVRDVRKKAGETVEVEGKIGHGTTVARITDFVKTNKVDLVVMGTRGANSVLDRLLGTNTAALMKQAPCPVLAIPAHARYKGFREIIFASDHTTQKAVFSSFLLNLAQKFEAELVVLNVKKDHQGNVGNEIEVPVLIRANYPYDHYNFVSIVEDDPERGIEEFVRKSKPQLLAVTVRRRNFVKGFFHRSIINQLAYELPVPLLALPEETIAEKEKLDLQEPEKLADYIL
jgi:nucleotide-binding universal stress UspA family protein